MRLWFIFFSWLMRKICYYFIMEWHSWQDNLGHWAFIVEIFKLILQHRKWKWNQLFPWWLEHLEFSLLKEEYRVTPMVKFLCSVHHMLTKTAGMFLASLLTSFFIKSCDVTLILIEKGVNGTIFSLISWYDNWIYHLQRLFLSRKD